MAMSQKDLLEDYPAGQMKKAVKVSAVRTAIKAIAKEALVHEAPVHEAMHLKYLEGIKINDR